MPFPLNLTRADRTRHAAVLALLVLTPACGEPRAEALPPGALPGGPPPALDLTVERPWTAVPGVLAVDDAVRLDGGWVLLDGAEGLVHVLDTTEHLVRSVGGRGDGPGELGAPRHLVGEGERLWVVGADGRLDLFDASGTFQEREHLHLEACPLADIEAAAALDGRLFLAVVCSLDRRRRSLLVRVERDGRTRVLLDRPSPSGSALTLYAPRLVAAGDRLALGTGEARCLAVLDAHGGAAEADLCLSGLPVPLAPEMRRELEVTVGRQARAVGLRLEIPEHLPWFDALLAGTGREILARRPVSATRWRLERLGTVKGGWSLPEGVQLLGSQGRLLFVHHGAEGVSILEAAPAELAWSDASHPSRTPVPR